MRSIRLIAIAAIILLMVAAMWRSTRAQTANQGYNADANSINQVPAPSGAPTTGCVWTTAIVNGKPAYVCIAPPSYSCGPGLALQSIGSITNCISVPPTAGPTASPTLGPTASPAPTPLPQTIIISSPVPGFINPTTITDNSSATSCTNPAAFYESLFVDGIPFGACNFNACVFAPGSFPAGNHTIQTFGHTQDPGGVYCAQSQVVPIVVQATATLTPPTPSPTPTPTATPTPGPIGFITLGPVSAPSALPAPSACASSAASFAIPENAPWNANDGTGFNSNASPSATPTPTNYYYANAPGGSEMPPADFALVDGNCRGACASTEDIMLWASCKYGISVDTVRAQSWIDSAWHQDCAALHGGVSTNCNEAGSYNSPAGDTAGLPVTGITPGGVFSALDGIGACLVGGVQTAMTGVNHCASWGIAQSKVQTQWMGYPMILNSSSFALDHRYAEMRGCMNGDQFSYFNSQNAASGTDYQAAVANAKSIPATVISGTTLLPHTYYASENWLQYLELGCVGAHFSGDWQTDMNSYVAQFVTAKTNHPWPGGLLGTATPTASPTPTATPTATPAPATQPQAFNQWPVSGQSVEFPTAVPTPHPMFAHYHLAYSVTGATLAAFEKDIQDAQALGFTGFVLNEGGWTAFNNLYAPRVRTMYQAANALGTGFKLILNPDTSAAGWTVADMKDAVTEACADPANFKYNGKCVFGSWSTQNFPNPNSMSNAKCGSAGSPWACCTGAGTGTCVTDTGNTAGNNNGASWRTSIFGGGSFAAACTSSGSPYPCCTAAGVGATCVTPGAANVFFVPEPCGSSIPTTQACVEIPTLGQMQTTTTSWNAYVDGFWHGGGEIAAVPIAGATPDKLAADQNWTTAINANTCYYGGKCINMAEPANHFWEEAFGTGSARYYEYNPQGIINQWMQYINTTQPDWFQQMSWEDIGESWITPNPALNDGGGTTFAGNSDPQGGVSALEAYYIKWYQTGAQPRINTDQLYYAYRAMPKTGACTGTQSGQQFGTVLDNEYVVTMVSGSGATPVVLSINTNGVTTNYTLVPGVNVTTQAFTVSTTQQFTLKRNGVAVIGPLSGPAIVANDGSHVCDYNWQTGAGYSNGYVYPPYAAGGLAPAKP